MFAQGEEKGEGERGVVEETGQAAGGKSKSSCLTSHTNSAEESAFQQ